MKLMSKPGNQIAAKAHASECYHQWTYAFTLSSKGKPPIKIDQCVRCGVKQKQSAHASEPWTQNSNELYKGSGLENFVGLALNSHEAWKIKDAHNATLQPQPDDTKRLDHLLWYFEKFCGEKWTRESIDAAMSQKEKEC